MKKFELLSNRQAEEIVESNKERLVLSVKESLNIEKLSPFNEWIIAFSNSFWSIVVTIVAILGSAALISTSVVLGIRGGGDFFSTGTGITMLVFGITLFLIGAFFFGATKFADDSAEKRVSYDRTNAYKKFFEGHFENLEFERFSTYDEVVDFSSYRPTDVPSDAILDGRMPGPTGKIDGMQYYTAWNVWHWTRSEKNFSGQSKVVDYYFKVFGLKVEGISKRYEKTSLNIYYPRPGFKSANNHQLENETFNKISTVSTNDEVALRRLLTPFIQEQLVRLCGGAPNKTNVYLEKNTFVMIIEEDLEIFGNDFKYSLNRDELFKSIAKDLGTDIRVFLALLSKVSIFKTLKTG